MSGPGEGMDEKSKKSVLEENIKALGVWRVSLRRGQFTGEDCLPIGGLLNFLDTQYSNNLAEYEAESVKHPEWGRPSELATA